MLLLVAQFLRAPFRGDIARQRLFRLSQLLFVMGRPLPYIVRGCSTPILNRRSLRRCLVREKWLSCTPRCILGCLRYATVIWRDCSNRSLPAFQPLPSAGGPHYVSTHRACRTSIRADDASTRHQSGSSDEDCYERPFLGIPRQSSCHRDAPE